MKQFNLQEWLANPSRKVVTRDGRPVRILCTDAKDKYGCCIIAAVETDGEEEGYQFFKDGKAYSSKSSIEDCADLFFADEGEELTEFEKALLAAFNCVAGKAVMAIGVASFQEDVDEWSKPLLDLARKKILKDLPKLTKTKPSETTPYVGVNNWYMTVEDFLKLPKEE